MLQSLSIQNFALIEKTVLRLDAGFHVITGETGSGKSILLGALNQILGERADLSLVRDTGKKAVIEATFQVDESRKSWFEENDIDFDPETIIRRELSAQGKSRAFINDTPVQLMQLKELTEQLVYIHSQHEIMELKKSSFQFDLVDAFGETTVLKETVAGHAREVKILETRISALENRQQESEKELDYIRFQLEELDKLELRTTDFAALESEFARLSRIDDLKEAYTALSEGMDIEGGPLEQLRSLKVLSDKLKENDPVLKEFSDRLQSAVLELSDLSQEAGRMLGHLDADPERVFWLTDNLNGYNAALRKHGVTEQQELLQIYESMQAQVGENENYDERLLALKNEHAALIRIYAEQAELLFARRSEKIPELEQHLLEILRQLKLEHASIQIRLEKKDRVDAWGGMEIQVLFSANKGLDFKPIEKSASGGELSRVMLAIQATMSARKNLPTLILDEIDTGVSGDVAARIGQLLKSMGANLQLIAITHLPQVAAKGSVHFEVKKSHAGEQTVSEIRRLTEAERIEAVATLLSGASVTESARLSAMELIRN